MLKLEPQDKEIIHKTHLLCGKSEDDIRDVYDSLITAICMAYEEGEELRLPILGELKIQYNGDKIVGDKKEAQLEMSIIPSDHIKKIIGEIVDGGENEIQNNLVDKIMRCLKDFANQG